MLKTGSILISMLLLSLCMQAQRQVVVADVKTREPIAQASLYSKTDGLFRSAITDEEGRATIAFAFQRLTVSHLNYEKRQVRQLSDTLFLTPRYRQAAEVVVTNREPAWIRKKLRQAAAQKEKTYFGTERMLVYNYQTQSIADRSYYRFTSEGLIKMKSHERKHYELWQRRGDITSLDSTLLTDVANLRRMLYEDFMDELDNHFIRSHRFNENPEFKGRSKNEIELVFRSKDRKDDRGRLVIDTARCVILSAYRNSGTKTNVDERMPWGLRTFASILSGYKVLKWNRNYRVSYAEATDGTLYPREVTYKFYMETHDNEQDKKENEYQSQTGGGFPNMEATLRLEPDTTTYRQDSEAAPWLTLPGSWYLRLSSEEQRRQEISLSRMPANFHLYEEKE